MELIVRHLSGSRQGQEQVFDSQSLTLGRNPVNPISFDAEKDLLVSSRHAELAYESDGWLVRDLGSTNGTFVNGARVTTQRLKPGDIVELGNGGPRLQLSFPQAGPAAAAPEMMVPEGRTVMMSMQQATAAPPPAAMPGSGPVGFTPMAPSAAATKRKSSPLRMILLSAIGLMMLILLAVLLMPKKGGKSQAGATTAATSSAQAASGTDTPATATTVPASAANVTPEQQKTMAEAEQLKTAIAQQQQTIKDAQQASTTAPASAQSQDMERQLRESQQMVEELQRQLQQKNDQVTQIQSRPAQVRTVVKYVPVPTPARAVSTPGPGAGSSPVQGRPTQAAGQQGQRPGQAVVPAAQQTPTMVLGEVVSMKSLKKKIKIQALPAEIPPASLPEGTPTELAAVLGRAVASTGNYLVVDNRGSYSANITVTNYLNNERTNLNTKSIGQVASTVGGLFGKSIPTSPGNVTSISSQTAMTTRLRVYNSRGKQMFEAAQSADAAATRSRASLEGLPFNQVLASDSTAGDVARRIIGQAAESLTAQLDSTEWTAEVTEQAGSKVTLDVGQNSKVEPGDVFEIVDRGRQVATVIVTRPDEDSSEAELVTGSGGKFDGKTIRYLGRRAKDPTVFSSRPVQILIRKKTRVYDGPGTSFKSVKELRQGTKVKYLYSLGTWAKASDGAAQFWVPMIFAEVQM